MTLVVGVAICMAGPLAAQTAQEAASASRVMTIEQVVMTAIRQNPELEAAHFGLLEAEERVSEAWGSVYPTLDLVSSYTRNLSPAVNFLPAVIFDPSADPDEQIPVRFGSDNAWLLSIDAEQPLFNAAAFIGVGAAGRFQALQEEGVRGQTQEVVTRVRTAYYQLLLAQEQVRLLENSVRRVRASLAETRALSEAGLSSEYDVLRLEVELANLEPNLRRAENAVLQGRRGLAVELNLPPAEAEGLRVAGTLATMDLVDPSANSADNRMILEFAGVESAASVDRLTEVALGARSDVRQLDLTEELRKTEMRLQQVEYLPKVSLFGTYAINSQQNGGPEFFGGPQAYSRFAGIRVSLPLFQGFQRDARIDQKRALMEQARTQTRYARSLARNEVQTVVEQMTEARSRAEAQVLAVTQATRGYEIASAQYREGLGSQLELTDAEVALRQSEFNYAEAVYDYLAARARLDAAVGQVPLADEGPAGGEGR